MKKIEFLNLKIAKKVSPAISIIFGISVTLISFIDFSQKTRIVILIVAMLLSILCYVISYIKIIKLDKLTLKINNSILTINFGDIFKQSGLKVIPFNEYFDTVVDDEIISRASLNGKYLETLESTETLENEINSSMHLKERILSENIDRKKGNKNKYKLGTIHKRVKYLLVAFSEFDDDNRANLTTNKYVQCLLNMWNEIDILYNGESVCLPLLGSGITRMKDYTEITDQELLEIIIWSFRISKVKFVYPSKITIVIDEGKKDKINLFKIEGE